MQGRCAFSFQDFGGVLSGQRDCLQAVTGNTQQVVRADGGLAVCSVAVERSEDASLA